MEDRWHCEFDRQGRLIRMVDQEAQVEIAYEWHEGGRAANASHLEQDGRMP